MTDVPIQPSPFQKEIVSVQITIDNFQLDAKECSCSCYCYDAQRRLLDVQRVQINEEEYAAWGTDDSYIVDLCLTKLGFQKEV